MARKLTINKPAKPYKGRHIKITQRATPITYTFDEAKIGEPVARAWRDAVSAGIQRISATGKDGKHKYANVTGKLARGLRLVREGAAWLVVPPPGRLGRGWTQEALDRFMATLSALVPAIGAPLRTFKTPPLQAALKASVKAMTKKGRLKKG